MSTETIRAAHDLTICYDETSWRLYNGLPAATASTNPMPALVVAHPTEIVCTPTFAHARNLPLDGPLLPADISQVVVGWATESRTWNLGLLLAAKPDTQFKTNWCGLASWPSGTPGESYDVAYQAAQALARLIKRPLHLVPAPEAAPLVTGETQAVQATTRMVPVDVAQGPPAQPVYAPVPEIPVNRPPFMFDDWMMREGARGFTWTRRRRWVLSAFVRASGLFVLSICFVLLGVGAQSRGLADVEPGWLPMSGLLVAATLLALALRAIWAIMAAHKITVDMLRREVVCQRQLSGGLVWRIPFDRIEYVLVSQSPPRPQGQLDHPNIMGTQQDVWLHLSDGNRFLPVVELLELEGQCRNWQAIERTHHKRGRRALKLVHYDTPAHHAARVMAQAIGAKVWLDIR